MHINGIAINGIKLLFIMNLANIGDCVALLSNQDLSQYNSDEIGSAINLAMYELPHAKNVNLSEWYAQFNYNGLSTMHDEKRAALLVNIQTSLDFYKLGQSSFVTEAIVENIETLEALEARILKVNLESNTNEKSQKPRRKVAGYIYVIKAISPEEHYKIGLSKTPIKRIDKLGVQLPFPIEPIYIAFVEDVYGTERNLHNQYAEKRVGGEWFLLTDSDIANIINILGGVAS